MHTFVLLQSLRRTQYLEGLEEHHFLRTDHWRTHNSWPQTQNFRRTAKEHVLRDQRREYLGVKECPARKYTERPIVAHGEFVIEQQPPAVKKKALESKGTVNKSRIYHKPVIGKPARQSHMLLPEKNGKAPNWLLIGVLGEAQMYMKSSDWRWVRLRVGSEALRWILGRERARDSREARIYGREKIGSHNN